MSINFLNFYNILKIRKIYFKQMLPFLVSLFSQAISSLTNFLILFFLVRFISKIEFAIYSVSFAVILLFSGLISSFMAIQYVVNLPEVSIEKRDNCTVNYTMAVFFLGSLFIAFSIFFQFFLDFTEYRDLYIPIAFCILTFSLRDFLVRVAFSYRRECVVLVSATLNAVGVSCAFFALWSLNVSRAWGFVLALSFGQLLGGVIAWLMLRLSCRLISLPEIVSTFRSSWGGGKWDVLLNIIFFVRTQAHNFVIAPILGLSALADVNAARILITPAVMALPPLTQILMPRLVDRQARGDNSSKIVYLSVSGIGAFAVFYSVVLLGFLPRLLPLVLGDLYSNVGNIVALWCGVAILISVRSGFILVFQVKKLFKLLLLPNLIAAIISILLSIVFIFYFEAIGVLLSMIISESVLCYLLFRYLKK